MPLLSSLDSLFSTFAVVYCTSFLHFISAKNQTAQKCSQLRGGEIIRDDDEDDDEEEHFVAAWKPYRCPVPGCSKRYLIKR